MAFTDATEEKAVIADLNAARDDKYAEVLERLPAAAGTGRRRRSRSRDLRRSRGIRGRPQRFRTWLGKIAARDYFHAPAGKPARAAVDEAAAELAAFEEAALDAEAPEPNTGRAQTRPVDPT
jgi:hypothetical protein